MRSLTLSIGVMTTNHNTWDLAARCANDCYRHDEGHFESLTVYDDCSTTPNTAIFPSNARIVMGRPNLGLTRSVNTAVRLLSEDIIVLFDSDAYPTTAFCAEVRSMFETDECLGLIAFHTVGKDGQRTESCSSEPNVWSLLLGQHFYAKYEWLFADRTDRISVFTCAMAFRRQAFNELGGFDEAFDWLDLDHDFSMRMNRSMWVVKTAENARMFHEGGGTPQSTRKRVMRFYKVRWYLLNKFGRVPFKKLVKWLILTRLAVEYTVLRIGELLFRSKRLSLSDKRKGRADLLVYCFQHY